MGNRDTHRDDHLVTHQGMVASEVVTGLQVMVRTAENVRCPYTAEGSQEILTMHLHLLRNKTAFKVEVQVFIQDVFLVLLQTFQH